MLVDMPAAQHKKIFFILSPGVFQRGYPQHAAKYILGSAGKSGKRGAAQKWF
jgi:hypothetical protein